MIRWTPVLAHGGSLTIRCGLITPDIPDIYPRSVTKNENVPTTTPASGSNRLPAADKAEESLHRTNEFVMMSMGLAEFLAVENSGQ